MEGKGTHSYLPDPRNAEILIDVNGAHFPRDQARVSVFDSGFMLGDGVWEGLRLHGGRLAFLDRHLDRLWRGAKAIAMDIGVSRDAVQLSGLALTMVPVSALWLLLALWLGRQYMRALETRRLDAVDARVTMSSP